MSLAQLIKKQKQPSLKKEKKQEQITKKLLPIVEQIMRGTNG